MAERVSAVAASEVGGFPHHGDTETGVWTTTPDGFWTGGFWVGELFLAARLTGDDSLRSQAETWLARLQGRVESQTVFRGFLFYYSAVVGAELFGSEAAVDLAAGAAASLSRTFDQTARVLPLGAQAEEAHTVGANEVNVDGLTASPLLLWAAQKTGDEALRQMGIEHALRTADFCVLPDGSVIQSASFDPDTGRLLRRYTHKGFSDESIWTRAQAWAMLGFSLCARLAPGEKRFLQLAENTTDWWLDHVPEDGVAYWDFSVPVTAETMRDTSGTAIAAAAMLKLADLTKDETRARGYEAAARHAVDSMVQNYLTPVGDEDRRPVGMLTQGCFDPKSGTAISSELIWGDYFLFESLARLNGALRGAL